MDTQKIIDGIVAKRNEIDEKERAKRKKVEEKERNDTIKVKKQIKTLEKKIRTLAPRIKDLLEIAYALDNNGFLLGNRQETTCRPEFAVQEEDSYTIGFHIEKKDFLGNEPTGSIGMYRLAVDRKGIVTQSEYDFSEGDNGYFEYMDYANALERFVCGFDEFEKKFLAYAQDPTPYR